MSYDRAATRHPDCRGGLCALLHCPQWQLGSEESAFEVEHTGIRSICARRIRESGVERNLNVTLGLILVQGADGLLRRRLRRTTKSFRNPLSLSLYLSICIEVDDLHTAFYADSPCLSLTKQLLCHKATSVVLQLGRPGFDPGISNQAG